MNCYRGYLRRKQHEAVFGFYVNLRVYLERLNEFLGETLAEAPILSRMLTKETNETESTDIPYPELLSAYVCLCKDLLSFLSASKDNVPPIRGENNFNDWFEHQRVLVKFLQEGVLLSNEIFGRYNKKDLSAVYDSVKTAIKALLESIKERICKDAKNS